MEEKERYTWFACGCCVDNQDNLNIVNCIERLNQQDKQIKELEKTKQYLDKVKSIYCNKCRCEIQKHYKDCVFRAFDNECCGDLTTIFEAYSKYCEINKLEEAKRNI